MNYSFESKLAPYMEGLIKQKQSDGFKYHHGELLLKRLDTFCLMEFPDAVTVTYEMAAKWSESRSEEGEAYHNSRMSIMKALSIYMLSLGLEAFVPTSFNCKTYRPVLYIPSKEEFAAFIKEVDNSISANKSQERLKNECKILFLLYFCCGLRLSEGRLIKREHVDLQKGTITILDSKGNKDRLVYLPEDGTSIIADYKRTIEDKYPNSIWMFPGHSPQKPISCSGVEACFNRHWAMLAVAKNLKKHPTPHCLRHAFVVERLNRWMAMGIDINKMMPYLSRYLGHKSPDETFYYYHLIDKAFDIIRNKDSKADYVIPEVTPYEE